MILLLSDVKKTRLIRIFDPIKAAEYLGITYKTLMNQKKSGKINYIKIGNYFFFTQSSLNEYKKSRKKGADHGFSGKG